MATITWFMTNTLVSVHQEMSETSPGADATSSPNVGWTVSTTAPTVYAEFDAGTKAAAATFSATARPDGSINTSIGDCLRTTNTYNGSFASANWTINGMVIGVTNSGAQDGRLRYRLFRSTNADGSGATEITAGAQLGATITNLSTSQQNSSVTFNPGAFSLTNEYLFIQIGWEITGAGGMSTTDVVMRVGTTATRVVSSNFTASSSAYTADVNETVSLSESLGAVFNTAAGPSESVSVAESLGAGYQARPVPAETVLLSEGLGSLYAAAVGPGETIGLSEGMTGGLALEASISEDVGAVGESLGSTYGAVAAPGETVSLSESTAAGYAAGVAVGESVALSESAAGGLSASAAVGESVALVESVGELHTPGATGAAYTAEIAETVSLSEALDVIATVAPPPPEAEVRIPLDMGSEVAHVPWWVPAWARR